jgi:uncharacterized protein (DUF433 family)
MENYIEINSQILVGKPVIKGTRIPVTLILNLVSHGYSIDQIVTDYPALSRESITAALQYAEDRLEREQIYLNQV